MDLFVFLPAHVPLPRFRTADVREGSTHAETGDLDGDVIIAWDRFIAVQRWCDTEEEEQALLRELFDWLATIEGDWQVVHTTWTPIAHRKAGRIHFADDYRHLAAA